MKIHRRYKKGFTLVEMIVVIAIIAVLAAILIPTIVGYVLRSRVATINSVASELRKNINYFFTQADVDGYGMLQSEDALCEPKITIVNGLWTAEIADEADLPSLFRTGSTYEWVGSGSARSGDPRSAVADADTLFVLTLADLFPEIQNGYLTFCLYGGKCTALYFTEEVTDPITGLPAFGEDGWSADSYEWDYTNQGVTKDGYIVGTAPILILSS